MKIPDAKAAVDKEWEKLEKLPAWQMTKVKSKSEVILEAQYEQRAVLFGTLMDIYHLKNAELEPKYQKYKGRVVLRGDIVQDDTGSYAVSTEQGSSASQMTAATVMDVIARVPDCDGQAGDAVSAHTQVKMEDAPRLLKIPKSECPDFWNVFHDINGQNLGQTWFLLNEIYSDIHLLVSCGTGGLRKFQWNLDGNKSELGMPVCSSKTKIVLIRIRG